MIRATGIACLTQQGSLVSPRRDKRRHQCYHRADSGSSPSLRGTIFFPGKLLASAACRPAGVSRQPFGPFGRSVAAPRLRGTQCGSAPLTTVQLVCSTGWGPRGDAPRRRVEVRAPRRPLRGASAIPDIARSRREARRPSQAEQCAKWLDASQRQAYGGLQGGEPRAATSRDPPEPRGHWSRRGPEGSGRGPRRLFGEPSAGLRATGPHHAGRWRRQAAGRRSEHLARSRSSSQTDRALLGFAGFAGFGAAGRGGRRAGRWGAGAGRPSRRAAGPAHSAVAAARCASLRIGSRRRASFRLASPRSALRRRVVSVCVSVVSASACQWPNVQEDAVECLFRPWRTDQPC